MRFIYYQEPRQVDKLPNLDNGKAINLKNWGILLQKAIVSSALPACISLFWCNKILQKNQLTNIHIDIYQYTEILSWSTKENRLNFPLEILISLNVVNKLDVHFILFKD